MLAPRVNAAGRMSTPDIATRLLLASDEAMGEEVRALALQLDGENVRRQEEEAEILAAAKKIVQTDPDVGARSVLVVAGDGWHRGVIGIVASKLVDAFHRPAIVLSIEDGVAHGSCRSIPQLRHARRARALRARCSIRFGGHKQAAGLTLDAARIKELRARGQRRGRRNARARRPDAAPADRRRPDVPRHHRRRRGRRRRAGAVRRRQSAAGVRGARVEIVDGPRKLKERHLKMALRQDGRIFRAIAWRAAERHDYLDRAQGRARRRLLAGAESVQWRDVRRADPCRYEAIGEIEDVRLQTLRTATCDRSQSCNPAI